MIEAKQSLYSFHKYLKYFCRFSLVVYGLTYRYKTFGDAVIDSIHYQIKSDKGYAKDLTVCVICLNWQTDQWEKVKIDFINVKYFRFIETAKIQNSVIFEALLKEVEGKIIIDFYPIQVDGLGKLEEDPNSSFAIHCTALAYEVLGQIE